MNREEACGILNIEEAEELDPEHVMERFNTLMEKNQITEKGGSFYIQSKVYFAKEHLMMDFEKELNESPYNPNFDENGNEVPEDADKD
jgi:hypothetical protein